MPKRRLRDLLLTNPFELFISATCALSGFSVALGAASPSSVVSTLPPALQVIWGCALGGGGVTALAGLVCRVIRLRWFLSGLAVECAGMALLTASSLSYAIIILFYVDLRQSLVAAAVQIALSLASLARAYAIRRITRKIEGG